MNRFLAIVHLTDARQYRWHADFEALAREAKHRGLHPVETLVDPEHLVAYTLWEPATAATVRDAHAAGGLPASEVVEVVRLHTELLAEPRRERYA